MAGALISITPNPLLVALVDPADAWSKRHRAWRRRLDRRSGRLARPALTEAPMSGHAVICGWGRVGRTVARALDDRGFGYVVVEEYRRADPLPTVWAARD